MAELGALISRAAEESYVRLKELVEKCNSSNLSDSEKKIGIHKYIIKTKQRMLRLNVLLKWCQQVPLIQYTVEVLRTGSYECLPKCMEDVGLQRLLYMELFVGQLLRLLLHLFASIGRFLGLKVFEHAVKICEDDLNSIAV